MFRSNTVSRLGPNAVILKPLTRADYRKIAEEMVKTAIARNSDGQNKHFPIQRMSLKSVRAVQDKLHGEYPLSESVQGFERGASASGCSG